MNLKFYSLLGIKALLMIVLILFAGIGLGPDEAQYWTWSRHLDFGYYSKPPAIAWQIFLGTSLFGHSELGVRFGSVILGAFLAYAIFRMAKKAGCSDEAAYFAGLIAAFSPFGVFGSFFAITDTGMLLFFTLGLTEIVEVLQGKCASGVRLGVYIALGSLFKWPIFILLPMALYCFPFIEVVKAACLSLMGLLPSLYWNLSHDFATFKHVLTIAKGGPNEPAKGNPLDFFGSQAAILSPLLFLLLLIAWFKGIVQMSRSLRFLGFFSLLVFTAYFGYAFFKKVQGNWALYFFPPAIVFLAAYWVDMKRSFLLLYAGLGLSLILLVLVFSLPLTSFLPWKMNPFKHNLGWNPLEDWIGKQTDDWKLLSDKYQNTSILSFYNQAKVQAGFLNLQGTRKNQFSYWPVLEKGDNALFFVIENIPHLEQQIKAYPGSLTEFFEEVSEPEWIPLVMRSGETMKAAICYRCQNYNGKKLDDPEKY